MKNSQRCPKCDHTEIIRVEVIQGGYGSGNVIPTGGFTIGSSIKVTRYVCIKCGYCEEWIDSTQDLQRLLMLSERQSAGVLRRLQTFFGTPVFEKLNSETKDITHG